MYISLPESTHLSLLLLKPLECNEAHNEETKNKVNGNQTMPNNTSTTPPIPTPTPKKGKQPRFCTSNVNDSPKLLHISKGSGISSASKKGAPQISPNGHYEDMSFGVVFVFDESQPKPSFVGKNIGQPNIHP